MKYKVKNPRGIPEDVPVLTLESQDGSTDYYEGDEFEWPVDLPGTEAHGIIERIED